MKISFDIECTPQEARTFFGLPDVTPVHDLIVGAMMEKTRENIDTLADPKVFWERAIAAGGSSMEAMSSLFSAAVGAGSADPRQSKGNKRD